MGDEKAKSIGESTIDSMGSGVSMGIPEALGFDRIINGGTCPVSKLPNFGCSYSPRSRTFDRLLSRLLLLA